MAERIGLIAGNGRLPFLFAEAARDRGLQIVAVAHRGETDPALEGAVDGLSWVRLGQLRRMANHLRDAGVRRAVMLGGIGRVRAFSELRPDWGALEVVAGLRSFRDDALLRSIASFFQRAGIEIVSSAPFLENVLAPAGHLAGPPLSEARRSDVELGREVAQLLGKADVGQTVVLKNRNVLALEAVEGTDEAIRRGAALGGSGVVVVKLCKPGQDLRFDLPTVGEGTIRLMEEVSAKVLAIEARRTFLLDAQACLRRAGESGISVLGIAREGPLEQA